MPRTDKEIAEYVRYYAKNNHRKWAVEMLTKTEGKTAEEIEHICNVENGKVGAQTSLRKPPKYSDEFIDAVGADRDAGMSYKDIADKYRMPLKQINSIMNIIRQKKKKASPTREPEAYPGQINDDEPEPIVESDVKVFIPGELPSDDVVEMPAKVFMPDEETPIMKHAQDFRVPADMYTLFNANVQELWWYVEMNKLPIADDKDMTLVELREKVVRAMNNANLIIMNKTEQSDNVAIPKIIAEAAAEAYDAAVNQTVHDIIHGSTQQLHAPAKNLYFALRDELRDFALGIFGAGAEIVEESVSIKYHDVSITVKTADGDHICFSVGKEKGKIVEEDE